MFIRAPLLSDHFFGWMLIAGSCLISICPMALRKSIIVFEECRPAIIRFPIVIKLTFIWFPFLFLWRLCWRLLPPLVDLLWFIYVHWNDYPGVIFLMIFMLVLFVILWILLHLLIRVGFFLNLFWYFFTSLTILQ